MKHDTQFFTEKQVAEKYGISIALLRKWRVKRRGGPPWKRIGRCVRYYDVAAWASAQPGGGGEQ